MPMPLFGRSRGRRRAEPIVQAPIFTESVLDLCPDVAPPSYPIRMPTPIPVATTSTNANANGVAPYPREYVSAAPRSYTDPNPFTTTEVEYDVSASDSAQFPENLHLAYTAASTSTSTSTAVPRLPRAVSLSAFADAVVWNSSARRATDDMERLEIREAPKPRLPRLTIPGEDGRSNESLLTQTQDGNWTATRQEASENRPEQQSQIQSQSQSGPKPKVESGYGYGPESSSAGHAQHQGQGSSQQRNSVGRATGFMGSVGVVLSASASAFRAADGNQNRLPDSTFHPERRGPQRESSFARLSPFRWFGKVDARTYQRPPRTPTGHIYRPTIHAPSIALAVPLAALATTAFPIAPSLDFNLDTELLPLASHQGEQGFGIHTAHRAEQGPDEIHTQDANSDWSDSDSVSERSSTSILYLSLPGGASKRREGRDTNTNTEVEADRSGDDEARYTWRYYGYNLPDPPWNLLLPVNDEFGLRLVVAPSRVVVLTLCSVRLMSSPPLPAAKPGQTSKAMASPVSSSRTREPRRCCSDNPTPGQWYIDTSRKGR
ncbi:hypothetical protein EHS25_005960 [Saitozyma podzolica]|uniref:Uncharacterized protein n=1 Tax=Saitozyma podzolica TaxID=1890683 RepID=A0A427XTT0_9TREE|nr:hypothetical protein EHS25_005960 [Saitozyma podzolica]